jgi:8-oxo-dGTP pyrophosphatase MutT (NUDIX family)
VPLPFLDQFDPVLLGLEDGQSRVTDSLRERYEDLAEAYERYAIRTASRWYLRAVALPVVVAEVELARAVVSRLRSYGSTVATPRMPLPEADLLLPYEPPGSVAVELAAPADHPELPRRIALSVWHRAGEHGALGYPMLTTSFEPLRYCVQGSEAATRADGASVVFLDKPTHTTASPALEQHKARLREAADQGVTDVGITHLSEPAIAYDGVLTRLQVDRDEQRGADRRMGFREEYDPLSGRQRLHLSLSEVAYSAVRATNYHVFGRDPDHPNVGASNLLTLNLICLDRNGVAVLVERSGRLGTHPHTFAGTVSGNAELAERQGIRADVDTDGLPDLRAAAAREAMEEVGLSIDPVRDHLDPVGIHTITSEYERGTHVLTLVSTLKVSARSWSPRTAASDPIEGAWEIGDHLMTLDLRLAGASRTSRQAFFAWLKSEQALATHAVGGLLAIMLSSSHARWDAVLDEFVTAAIVSDPALPDGVTVSRWRRANCGACVWDAVANPG